MAIGQNERSRSFSGERQADDRRMAAEPGERPPSDPSDAGLSRIILAIRRYLPLTIALTVVLSGIFALAVHLMPPRYSAMALVMIEPRKGQVFQFANVVTSLPPDLAVVKSETDVLQSFAMARKVAQRLDPAMRLQVVTEGLLPGIKARVRSEAARLRDALPADWAVLMDRFLMHRLPAPAGEPGPGAVTQGSAAGFPDADAFLDRVAKTLQERVDITVDGRSYVFHIRYHSAQAELAAAIVNIYGAAYIQDQLDLKRSLIRGASTRIEGGLDSLQRQARDSDMAVQRYIVDRSLFQVGGETVMSQQLGSISKELSQISAERAEREAVLNELTLAIQDPSGAAAQSAVLKSPLIERLREREADLMQRLANLRERYMENHPDIVAAAAALRDLRGKIADEIERIVRNTQSEVDTAARREAGVRERLRALQANAGIAEKDMVELRELQRRAAADRSLYEAFLRRSGETLAEQNIEMPDARIVSEAPVPAESSPPRLLLSLGGVLLSAVLAMLTAVLLERRRAGIRTELDAEALLGVPVFGMTLNTRGNSKPVDLVAHNRSSAYSESLAQIRTGVQQNSEGLAPKVVLVTSSIPGEGKSVFAASFARGTALSRIRTLVVECDMRRPTLATLLSSRAERPRAGLRSLGGGRIGGGQLDDGQAGGGQIGDARMSLDELIQTDPKTGLDFILAGDGDSFPEDVLRSLDFERLILEARQRYDLIILDAPPVLSVSDARIIAPLADHIILALRWDSTRPDVAQAALKRLRGTCLQGMGVVLTQVDMRKQALYQPQMQSYDYARPAGLSTP